MMGNPKGFSELGTAIVMILFQLRDYCINGCFFVDCYFIRILIICRYFTILYYLNNVEDGGETAFPVADMSIKFL